MLNFLLDITPDKSQLLITIKLAGILREKKQGRCVKMRTFFFYAQSPDFHKQGLCYYLKILYL